MITVVYESQLKLGPKKSVSIRREMSTVSIKVHKMIGKIGRRLISTSLSEFASTVCFFTTIAVSDTGQGQSCE